MSGVTELSRLIEGNGKIQSLLGFSAAKWSIFNLCVPRTRPLVELPLEVVSVQFTAVLCVIERNDLFTPHNAAETVCGRFCEGVVQ